MTVPGGSALAPPFNRWSVLAELRLLETSYRATVFLLPSPPLWLCSVAPLSRGPERAPIVTPKPTQFGIHGLLHNPTDRVWRVRRMAPNMSKMAATGYRGVARGALPSFTNVNNAAIVTGRPPAV